MTSEILSTSLVLFQMMCVVVVFAYLVTRTPYWAGILEGAFSWKNQLFLAVVFGGLSIYGTVSGVSVLGAPVNIRDLGPMVAGFLGGPIAGLAAGLIGAGYRMSLSGFSAVPCSIATILAGLLSGLIFLTNRRQFPTVPTAVSFAVIMEGTHMALVLLIARPFSEALDLVSQVAIPMIAVNAAGMFIFAFIIKNLLLEKKTREERDRFQGELERKSAELQIAREIQASFLPERIPDLPGYSIAAESLPAREVGGDFYDLISLPDRRVAVLIADVSDKGVPAALFMALSSMVMRATAIWHHQAASTVRDANAMIAAESKSGMFVTMFFAILDPDRGQLSYVNAGHNPPILMRRDGTCEILPATGIALGADPEGIHEERTVSLEGGSVLLLYTDGVTEAEDGFHRQFGVDRLMSLLKESREFPADRILSRIREAVTAHAAGAPQFDDITLLVMRVGS